MALKTRWFLHLPTSVTKLSYKHEPIASLSFHCASPVGGSVWPNLGGCVPSVSDNHHNHHNTHLSLASEHVVVVVVVGAGDHLKHKAESQMDSVPNLKKAG